jgi:hypothetical protein
MVEPLMPPIERGGNRYVQPTATAPHLDSTTRDGGEPVAGPAMSVVPPKAEGNQGNGICRDKPLRINAGQGPHGRFASCFEAIPKDCDLWWQ